LCIEEAVHKERERAPEFFLRIEAFSRCLG